MTNPNDIEMDTFPARSRPASASDTTTNPSSLPHPATPMEASETNTHPSSQLPAPTDTALVPQTQQHFAILLGHRFEPRLNGQGAPISLPVIDIPPANYVRKRQHQDDEPPKVRLIRQRSFGVEEELASNLRELKERQAAMEEKQKNMERTLQEADEWANQMSQNRKQEEVQRQNEKAQRKEEENKLQGQLVAAVQHAEALQAEVDKARAEAAGRIRELTLNSERMAAKMNEMAAKMLMDRNIEGEQVIIQASLLTEIGALNEPGPMELNVSYVPSLAPNALSLTPIPLPWRPSSQVVASQEHESHIKPPTTSDHRKGKNPVRGDEYDGDDDEDEGGDGDEDDDEGMEIMPDATERGLSETPEPSENEGAGLRANPVVQDTQNVPQPYRFAPPRGGGHSAADANLIANTTQRQSSRPPKISHLRTRTNQSWTTGLATYYGNNAIPSTFSASESPRKRTKAMAASFRRTTLKGFDPVGAKQKSGVRFAMNELLGIQKDEHITTKVSATEEEVSRYQDMGEGDPVLDPMRPYFLRGGFNVWNDCLCEKFVDWYEERTGVDFTDAQKADVETHFLSRIYRLGRLWRKSKSKTELEKIEEELKIQKRSRVNTRRMTLYDNRREIAVGNLENRDGTIHEGWHSIYNMLEKLGPTGMSSDESEVEGKRTVYIIKSRPWRSQEVHRLLLFIDSDRNRTSSTGGARPGNPPRERRRLTERRALESARHPSLQCPINYYDRVWLLDRLNNRQRRDLAPQPEESFPVMVHTSL